MDDFDANIKKRLKINDNLKQIMDRTGYHIIQSNGQRVYSPPESVEPPKGSEVFVGNIPRDMFEDELVPIFEQVGPIIIMRLMIDFSGTNRGYGFVSYSAPEVANVAVSLLHGYRVRPGNQLAVYKYLDNCRLFVGGIPQNKSKIEILEQLQKFVEGIKEIIMYQCITNKALNRGFVFVEFENHRLAAMAKRLLSPGSLILWGVPIMVDWAKPLPKVDSTVSAKVAQLYICNLDPEMSSEDLTDALNHYVSLYCIIRTHKISDHAFVHFVTREAAEKALEVLNGVIINGRKIDITWARPRMYSRSYHVNPPQQFYSSCSAGGRMQIENTHSLSDIQTSPIGSSSLSPSNISEFDEMQLLFDSMMIPCKNDVDVNILQNI